MSKAFRALLAALLVLLSVPGLGRSALAGSAYMQGLELYRSGKYTEAARVLRAALPAPPAADTALSAPAAPPAAPSAVEGFLANLGLTPAETGAEIAHMRVVLGFVLLRQNNLPEAEEQFSQLRREAPFEAAGLLGLGWCSFARGRTSAAVDLYLAALERLKSGPKDRLPDVLHDSTGPDARLGLGLIALGRGRAAEAAEHLEAAARGVDVLGSPKELFLALGDARLSQGNRQAALDAWAEVPRRPSNFPGDAPRDELARLKAAKLFEDAGDRAAALKMYQALDDAKHYAPEALLAQARLLAALGRAAEALSPLRRLVVLEPALAEPLARTVAETPQLRPLYKDWGLAYFHRASYLDALARLSAYLDDVDPGDYAANLALGWSHLRQGMAEQAQEAFATAAKARQGAAEPLAGLGASALGLGRLDEARGLLLRALKADSGNALAQNALGHLELAVKNPEAALEQFRASLKSRPDFVDSRLAVAKILFDRGDFDQAASEYFRLATQEKRSVAAWNGLGWSRLRQGRLEDARLAFAESRRINQGLPAAAYGLGITASKRGEHAEARLRLAEAIFQNPDFAATNEVMELIRTGGPYAELLLEFGQAYARRLYPTLAAPYLEEYLRQNPNSRPARRSLAWASLWAGQEDKAHALFQTLITVQKDDADAHLGDGLALVSRNRLDMAEGHLREAIRLDPLNAMGFRALALMQDRQGLRKVAAETLARAPRAREERLDRMSASGFAALAEGRPRDAVRDFERAVALDPGLAAPRYGLCFAHMALGLPRQAREELLAGLNLDPGYLEDQELGRLITRHLELKDLDLDLTWSQYFALNLKAARAGFERRLEAEPGSQEAQFGLAATAYLQGDWPRAEALYDKLLLRAPQTARSWDKWSHLMDNLGWSAFHQKKYDRSLSVFDWLRAYTPQTPYAAPLSGMGWALFMKGRRDQAQAYFAQSLRIFPRNMTATVGMTAMKKAPEGEEDEDEARVENLPVEPVKKSGRRTKSARKSRPNRRS